jgi:hypothetical protein
MTDILNDTGRFQALNLAAWASKANGVNLVPEYGMANVILRRPDAGRVGRRSFAAMLTNEGFPPPPGRLYCQKHREHGDEAAANDSYFMI